MDTALFYSDTTAESNFTPNLGASENPLFAPNFDALTSSHAAPAMQGSPCIFLSKTRSIGGSIGTGGALPHRGRYRSACGTQGEHMDLPVDLKALREAIELLGRKKREVCAEAPISRITTDFINAEAWDILYHAKQHLERQAVSYLRQSRGKEKYYV
jgi:hypothetical protein